MPSLRRSTRIIALVAALIGAAPGALHAQSAIACPERLQTLSVTLAKPEQIAGFTPVIGGDTSSQTWLQDVAVFGRTAGQTVLVPGTPKGKKRLDWRFDGQIEVWIGCVYEAGVTLHRSVGRPKSCTAAILRSKDPGGGSWGMDLASFKCN
ncbi:STY0301 family protein [Rhodopseudomonas palustris]|uniref:Uncharacterized protein n=1 Tax=Rhodopseudomonas palustris (strain HaA2) TaxID=316058 RepID=Q2IVI8_RHOP2|nr:STY0301 family protein [Rhodopseudomonas palustris]ABD07772.1 hypothetical protein RPB_3071 [Rhodopseudomonas palustris HaA2]WQG97824.1 STY0301 family protein [Rhodopseudomonas palustris]